VATTTEPTTTRASGIPQFPYRLVDEVVHVEPGQRAVGRKLVSANEPFFAGHFPGAPVMPGVLVCEALAQLAATLGHIPGDTRLVGVSRARFRRPVQPGDELTLVVTAAGEHIAGVVTCDEAVVAHVEFRLAANRGPRIHPTAIVHAGAELAPGVVIDAYAVVGAQVRLGADTWVGSHAVVEGRTTLGARNRVFQFASVGSVPQDLKFRGEPSGVTIGDDNQIREYVTINRGTTGGGMMTHVGSGCLFMTQSHVAHDAAVGNNVVLANGVALGGHVRLADYAIVGGLAGVHQFVQLGESSLCAAGAMVSQDVPPFCMVAGDRARLHGLNLVGLQRRGFSDETIRLLKRAYRSLFGATLRRQAGDEVAATFADIPEVQRLVAFVRDSERGVCRP
jgi:UDP-N-acetylglucosamine acyltransferase